MSARAKAAPPEPAPIAVRDAAALKLQLARRFVALMQTDQMGDMIAQMSISMTPAQPGMSQEDTEAMRSAIQRATAQMIPRMFDALAPVYADIFTVEELTGLVEFYESDIGRSMIAKSYAAGPRISEAIMGVMPALMRDMAETMCKELSCTAEQRAEMQEALGRSGYTVPAQQK